MPEQVSSSDFKRRWLPALGLVAAGVVLVGGWFLYSETRTSSPAAAASVPVPAVGVRPVVKKGVSESFEFVGHIKAVDKVDLRARVEGFLEKRLFVEGQFVKAGDLLYQIEKVQYEALVDQAKANLAAAEAESTNAKLEYSRQLELSKKQFSPQSVVDQNRAAMDTAADSVASGGTIVLFAPLPPGERWPIPVNEMFFKDVRIVHSYSAGPDDTRKALELLENGLPAGDLITHRLPLADVRKAYDLVRDAGEALKVIVYPQRS